jgi:YegS/Rv2252/BmrU family lipid kinase
MWTKKYFLIINPTAHSGRAYIQGKKIISILKNKNIDFDFTWTKRKTDAIEIATMIIKEKYNTVVACGGDGTICEIISGLFKNNELGPKPKLGVLHIGTSPDFNKYHCIPTKLEEAIDTLLRGKTKSIDIGKITYYSEPQRKNKTIAYFASNVNVGLGPLIAARANARYRKYLGDTLGTLSAMLISLIGFKKFNLQIALDGKEQNFNRLINLTVGKDPYLASGMRILTLIKPDDARLYVLSIEHTTWKTLLSSLFKLYVGNFLSYPGAKLEYAKQVKIDLCQEYPLIEFDGDVKGYLPATIEILPKALEIITD